MPKMEVCLSYETAITVHVDVPEGTTTKEIEEVIHDRGFEWEAIDKQGFTDTSVEINEIIEEPGSQIQYRPLEDFYDAFLQEDWR